MSNITSKTSQSYKLVSAINQTRSLRDLSNIIRHLDILDDELQDIKDLLTLKIQKKCNKNPTSFKQAMKRFKKSVLQEKQTIKRLSGK